MFKRFFFLIGLALSTAALSTHAQESVTKPAAAILALTGVDVPGYGVISYKALFEMHSEAGESMDAFAMRVAPRLRAFSDETHFEACGVIAVAADGRFGVIVGTNESHIGCVNAHELIPEGMTSTQQTIHSHGTDATVRPNKSDLALYEKYLGKYGMGYNTGRPRAFMKLSGQDVNYFSDQDHYGEDGYLAAGSGEVLHHTKRQVRTVIR